MRDGGEIINIDIPEVSEPILNAFIVTIVRSLKTIP